MGIARGRQGAAMAPGVLVASLALVLGLVPGVAAPSPAGASPGRGAPAAPELRAVPLSGPFGLALNDVRALNERGQVVAMGRTPTGGFGGVVLDARTGQAAFVAPWWAPWTTQSDVRDISDQGQIAGTNVWPSWPPYVPVPPGVPTATPFSWRDGAWVDLPTRSGNGGAWAVNARGEAVGVDGGGSSGRTVVGWRNGQRVEAPRPAQGVTIASMDLNDQGRAVVGLRAATTPATPAVVVWDVGTGGVTELDLGLPPETFVDLVRINGRGQVLVSARPTTTQPGPTVLWDPARGEAIDLGPLDLVPGVLHPHAEPLNAGGHVVGQRPAAGGVPRAVLWRDGEVVDLGTLGGDRSVAVSLNDRDEVVGHSTSADGEQHAFLWRDGVMHDLGALAGPGASTATQINDAGQVIGTLTRPDGTHQQFLWTPAPP